MERATKLDNSHFLSILTTHDAIVKINNGFLIIIF